jgi:hypothetical protein
MREFMSKNIKRVVSKRVEIIVGQHYDITALTIKRWKRKLRLFRLVIFRRGQDQRATGARQSVLLIGGPMLPSCT